MFDILNDMFIILWAQLKTKIGKKVFGKNFWQIANLQAKHLRQRVLLTHPSNKISRALFLSPKHSNDRFGVFYLAFQPLALLSW